MLAADVRVGADVTILLMVRAGDVQLVAIAVVHQMLADTHASAGSPFVDAGMGAGAGKQAAEQQYLGFVHDEFSCDVVQIRG